MSLGWQTESALLPSNSKKIDIDGKSIIGLKAIVYEKERSLHNSDPQFGNRCKGRAALKDSSQGRKDVFSAKNKGISDRIKSDASSTDSTTTVKSKVQASLKVKSELYNKLQSGLYGDSSNENSHFLVDFKSKETRPISQNEISKNILVSNNEPKEEIIDSFGRTRMVDKRSLEYKEYEITNDAKRFKHELQSRIDNEKKRRGISTTQNQCQSSSSSSSLDHTWSWSNGNDRNDAGDWIETSLRDRCYEDLIADKIEREVESVGTSKGARVKSTWEEKKIDSSVRAYLDEIHHNTQVQRGDIDIINTGSAKGEGSTTTVIVGSNPNSAKLVNKADRLELLRRKKEEHAKI